MIIAYFHANLGILFLLNEVVWRTRKLFFFLRKNLYLEHIFIIIFDWPLRTFPEVTFLQLQICETLVSRNNEGYIGFMIW